MHELSIAEALVKQVEAIVVREGATKVLSITVEVGALSGVDPDALATAFPFVAENSPATGKATLQIVTSPATVICGDCGTQQEESAATACGKCGSANLAFNGGRDLTFRSVELEFKN